MLQTRNELPLTEKWDVEALYKNPEDWRGDFEAFKGIESSPRWPQLQAFKGKLNEPLLVANLLDSYFSLDRHLSKLYTYAHLRYDEDLGADEFKRDYGLISGLHHEFQTECAWIEPELLSLNEQDFQRLVNSPELQSYRFFLQKIGAMRPHTLSPDLEEILALSGKALDTSYRAFGALNNADLSFAPAIDSQGNSHPLTKGSYFSLLKSEDRTLRRTAFENMHQAYKTHANVLSELIQGQMEGHLFVAKARKFNSCLEASLFPRQIDPSVYQHLIKSIREFLPFLHEYVALRKKILQLDQVHFYDLMVPLVDEPPFSMPYSEACEVVVASVAPLGKKYQDSLAKGLIEDRWVDVYETARKRSGAYSGGCYDSMPYILMNYQGTLNDVLTLAHEAGHSMHSLLSRTHQPYIYADYPIFVAEVASTFNEQLLLTHLKNKVHSKKELAYLIQYEMEAIRNTVFRQTLFAEFELKMHEFVEKGIPLTPSLLSEEYLKINRDYYGPDIVLDPELAIEWARIPHFYYNFYVYQYATGLSAALSLFKQVSESQESLHHYLTFLSSGGSKYPIDLLKGAGVDMGSTGPIKDAMMHFKELLEEFKNCLSL